MRPPILVFAINRGLQLSPQTLPTAIEGVAYEATLTAIRGQPPYEFTISPPGALDDLGLTFTDNGDGTATIAGATPTADTAWFTVTLADDAEVQVFRTYGLQVADIPQPPDPVVVTGTAPGGDVGDAYSYTFSATGGDGGPYTWSVVSGALPDGVTLNTSNGEISGTLTTDGTFNFTVRATDGVGATGDSAPQSVTIVAVPKFQLVTWTGSGAGARAISTNIDLSSGGVWWDYATTGMSMAQSADGSTWYSFGATTTASGVTSDYAYSPGSVTVPSSRNELGVVYYAAIWKREAGFCDVVVYTGTGAAHNVSHALGIAPTSIWVKKVAGTGTGTTAAGVAWLSGGGVDGYYNYNGAGAGSSTGAWNSTLPGSTQFTTGTLINTNGLSRTFVAVLFGQDEKISSGFYAGNNGVSPVPIAGFEAEFVIIRSLTASQGWRMFDTLRTPGFSGNDQPYIMNSSGFGAEFAALKHDAGSTYVDSSNAQVNDATLNYFYLAIKP